MTTEDRQFLENFILLLNQYPNVPITNEDMVGALILLVNGLLA